MKSSELVDESRLITAVARGDEQAVEQFFKTYADRVLRFVYRRIDERLEDAEEITQDTFLSAIRLAPQFRGEAPIFGWLCGIAKLRITDFMRREKRAKRIPHKLIDSVDELKGRDEPSESPAQSADDQMAAGEFVDSLLDVLSADEREALTLRYVEQLPVKEIAAILKRSEKAVEALLMRAKQKPRACAKRWMFGPEGGRP